MSIFWKYAKSLTSLVFSMFLILHCLFSVWCYHGCLGFLWGKVIVLCNQENNSNSSRTFLLPSSFFWCFNLQSFYSSHPWKWLDTFIYIYLEKFLLDFFFSHTQPCILVWKIVAYNVCIYLKEITNQEKHAWWCRSALIFKVLPFSCGSWGGYLHSNKKWTLPILLTIIWSVIFHQWVLVKPVTEDPVVTVLWMNSWKLMCGAWKLPHTKMHVQSSSNSGHLEN